MDQQPSGPEPTDGLEGRGGARPGGVGASLLRLLAEEDVPRVLRALRSGPLTASALRPRLADLAPSTLGKRLQRGQHVGAVSARSSPQGSQPTVYELTDFGRDLYELFASAHEWVVNGPGAEADELGRASLTSTVLGALANGAARELLHAVDEGADLPSALDARLTNLGHVRIMRLVERHEALRLLVREGRPRGSHARPIRVTTWGREAVAFVGIASRLEERYAVPGAVEMVPAGAARLLRFAAPLIQPRVRERGALRVTIDANSIGGAAAASFLIETGAGAVTTAESTPPAAVSAQARGPVSAWCDAILDGDRGGLEMTGNAGLADRLICELHARLFAS